jgi:hypothetical protein
LYKRKYVLTHPLYSLLKSFLTDRTLLVKYEDAYTDLYFVLSGVPQGSILGPKLYSIHTADLPETGQTTLATYADDTTILASHENPTEASRMLQMHLDQFEVWLQRWRIQANETKSVHVAFPLRHGNCPPVQLNGKKHTTRRNNQILRPSLGQATDMARTYTRQKETMGYQI